MSKVVKLGSEDLRRVIKEEAGKYNPNRKTYPQVGGNAQTVPFATIQKRWMELSGGLAPDEVTPEDHEEFIATIASGLGVDEDRVREQVVDWGEATSMNALSGAFGGSNGGTYAGRASDNYVEDDDYESNEPPRL